MILVAWDQQVGMLVAIRIQPNTGNLPAIIDRLWGCQVQSGIGRNQRVQIDH